MDGTSICFYKIALHSVDLLYNLNDCKYQCALGAYLPCSSTIFPIFGYLRRKFLPSRMASLPRLLDKGRIFDDVAYSKRQKESTLRLKSEREVSGYQRGCECEKLGSKVGLFAISAVRHLIPPIRRQKHFVTNPLRNMENKKARVKNDCP